MSLFFYLYFLFVKVVLLAAVVDKTYVEFIYLSIFYWLSDAFESALDGTYSESYEKNINVIVILIIFHGFCLFYNLLLILLEYVPTYTKIIYIQKISVSFIEITLKLVHSWYLNAAYFFLKKKKIFFIK